MGTAERKIFYLMTENSCTATDLGQKAVHCYITITS